MAAGGAEPPAAAAPDAGPPAATAPSGPPTIARSAESEAALRYRFSAEDERLLEEIQHGCFLYFWNEIGRPACLAKDRMKAPVASIASVGFQLSSLPIGVERGWITRAQGEERALTVLKALVARDDNRRFGVYLHYPDHNTGGPAREGHFEILAGTVDHALFMAGAIPAGEYFGGEVARLVDGIVADTNWRVFVLPNGWLSMGWKPDDPKHMTGSGKFIEPHWSRATCEERLIHFLAAGAPNPEYALSPESYYKLIRTVKAWRDMPPFAVSWGSTLFNFFFSHCWIEYRSFGADDPAKFGAPGPRIDWWENSRRAALTQRRRCLDEPMCAAAWGGAPGSGAAGLWGLSACVGREGYIVPELRPNEANHDHWFDCTIAPYAAGSAIMFTPQESMAALRAMRELKDEQGRPLVWQDPQAGGYGLADAFCLKQKYVSDDYVGIDEGPLLLAIENARTGLIWKLFMRHAVARRAVERLKLE